jgi:hypothetical protein
VVGLGEGWEVECAPGCEGVGGYLGEAEKFFALDGVGIVLEGVISSVLSAVGGFARVWCTLSSFMKRFRILSTSSRSTARGVSLAGRNQGAEAIHTVGTLNNVL